MNRKAIAPAACSRSVPEPPTTLRGWFAWHPPRERTVGRTKPAAPNRVRSTVSETLSSCRDSKTKGNPGLVACAAFALCCLWALALRSGSTEIDPSAVTNLEVAPVGQHEIPAPRSAAPQPDARKSGTVAVKEPAPAAACAEPEPEKETVFLGPGERLNTVYPDGLLVESLGKQGAQWTGLRKVPFENLPESVRRRFGFDAQKAAEYKAAQARAMSNYRAEQQRAAQALAARQEAAQPESPELESEKVEILKALVFDYRKNHTYSMEDRFVCADMACDVWNMVRTKGIPAKIQVGNVNRDITSVTEADHAWVLAEVSAGKWLALETTAGRVVCQDENPRYYKGWSFENPKGFKEFQYQHSSPR